MGRSSLLNHTDIHLKHGVLEKHETTRKGNTILLLKVNNSLCHQNFNLYTCSPCLSSLPSQRPERHGRLQKNHLGDSTKEKLFKSAFYTSFYLYYILFSKHFLILLIKTLGYLIIIGNTNHSVISNLHQYLLSCY